MAGALSDDNGTIRAIPARTAEAAEKCGNAQAELYAAWRTLAAALDGCAGMAGAGRPASEFNAGYDLAVATAWQGFEAACRKLGAISVGLTQTANNVAMAEHHSNIARPGSPQTYPRHAVLDAIEVPGRGPAMSHGGSLLPGRLVGHWPEPDSLRTAAHAWITAAGRIASVIQLVQGAVESIDSGDDTSAAIAEFCAPICTAGDQRTLLPALEQMCRSLADTCSGFAQIANEAAGAMGLASSFLEDEVRGMLRAILPGELIGLLRRAITQAPDLEVVAAETTQVGGATGPTLAGKPRPSYAGTRDGHASNPQKRGKGYEKYFRSILGAGESFHKGQREFDGKIPANELSPEIWCEAKSGRFWDEALKNPGWLHKFKSSLAQQSQIAEQHGARLMVVSENQIPAKIVEWLTRKGILNIIVP